MIERKHKRFIFLKRIVSKLKEYTLMEVLKEEGKKASDYFKSKRIRKQLFINMEIQWNRVFFLISVM